VRLQEESKVTFIANLRYNNLPVPSAVTLAIHEDRILWPHHCLLDPISQHQGLSSQPMSLGGICSNQSKESQWGLSGVRDPQMCPPLLEGVGCPPPRGSTRTAAIGTEGFLNQLIANFLCPVFFTIYKGVYNDVLMYIPTTKW
jgi:hypothetical protein